MKVWGLAVAIYLLAEGGVTPASAAGASRSNGVREKEANDDAAKVVGGSPGAGVRRAAAVAADPTKAGTEALLPATTTSSKKFIPVSAVVQPPRRRANKKSSSIKAGGAEENKESLLLRRLRAFEGANDGELPPHDDPKDDDVFLGVVEQAGHDEQRPTDVRSGNLQRSLGIAGCDKIRWTKFCVFGGNDGNNDNYLELAVTLNGHERNFVTKLDNFCLDNPTNMGWFDPDANGKVTITVREKDSGLFNGDDNYHSRTLSVCSRTKAIASQDASLSLRSEPFMLELVDDAFHIIDNKFWVLFYFQKFDPAGTMSESLDIARCQKVRCTKICIGSTILLSHGIDIILNGHIRYMHFSSCIENPFSDLGWFDPNSNGKVTITSMTHKNEALFPDIEVPPFDLSVCHSAATVTSKSAPLSGGTKFSFHQYRGTKDDLTFDFYFQQFAPSQKAIVEAVYCRVLKRRPENDGVVDGWANWLQTSGSSIKALIKLFMLSGEFKRKFVTGKTNREVAPLFYDVLLARGPDRDGLTYWANYFGEFGLVATINEFMGSTEYAGKFGENSVPGDGRQSCNL